MEACLVAGEIVAHQLAIPLANEVAGMLARMARAEVVNDCPDRRKRRSAVGPDVSTVGFFWPGASFCTPDLERCGLWAGGRYIKAIEAYPSACKRSACIKAMRLPFYEDVGGSVTVGKFKARPEFHHVDLEDALPCALIAWSFENRPDLLANPTSTIDPGKILSSI